MTAGAGAGTGSVGGAVVGCDSFLSTAKAAGVTFNVSSTVAVFATTTGATFELEDWVPPIVRCQGYSAHCAPLGNSGSIAVTEGQLFDWQLLKKELELRRHSIWTESYNFLCIYSASGSGNHGNKGG